MAKDTDNIKKLLKELSNVGIKNTNIQSGILATIGKESGFKPQTEWSYSNTPNSNLRALFSAKLKPYNEEELTKLKANDDEFFDVIYGGVYGNTSKGDGFLYRGGGLNQITFKSAYERYGKLIGVDLVKYPDKLNEMDTAIKVASQFFKVRLTGNQPEMKSRFGVTDVNKLDELKKAIQIAVNANAGWGKDKRGSETEKKAFEYMDKLSEYLGIGMKTAIEAVKKEVKKK